MILKMAHEIADGLRKAQGKGVLLHETESTIVVLDNRVAELEKEIDGLQMAISLSEQSTDKAEAQRDALLKAAGEMLNMIESTYYEDDDGAPNNDDMNRWHRAVQTGGVALEKNNIGGKP